MAPLWVKTTPFGCPVEPDVYIIAKSSSGFKSTSTGSTCSKLLRMSSYFSISGSSRHLTEYNLILFFFAKGFIVAKRSLSAKQTLAVLSSNPYSISSVVHQAFTKTTIPPIVATAINMVKYSG